jgi:molybdopterin molybdotransferase
MLHVIGSAPAGHPFVGTVGPGQSVRLFTGSVVPRDADAILLQEDATASGTEVRVNEAVTAGRHIRRAGQDFAAGDAVVPAGRRLTARDIGLAAAANHPWLTAHRRPRVAILATGDEIAMPGEPIPPGGIVSSNSHALAALVRAAGGTPVVLPVAADTHEAVAAVADAVHGMDLLVTTGGASVGDHDLVIESLRSRGLKLDFWQIAMRPGKPLLFGTLGAVPVLGLPGNPVSALVCSILFLLPALNRLGGLPAAAPPTVQAVAGTALRANDHRADHLRATVTIDQQGRIVATPFPVQDSAMLRRLALADALILRAPNAPALPAGGEVTVIRLDSLGL